MFKKIIAACALVASTSFAAWDVFPILPGGQGQVKAAVGYTDQDPLTTLESVLGARFSLTDWLELSLQFDYLMFTHVNGDDVELDGPALLNPGIRFQLSPAFSIYGDMFVSLDDELTGSDYLTYDFGVQHTSVFGFLAWGSDLGLQMNTGNDLVVFKLADEMDLLLGAFAPLVGFDFYFATEFSDETANGYEFYFGAKFSTSQTLMLEFTVRFRDGELFEKGIYDDPTLFEFDVFYNF